LQNNYSENREVEKNIEKRKRIGSGQWQQLLAVFGGGSGGQWGQQRLAMVADSYKS